MHHPFQPAHPTFPQNTTPTAFRGSQLRLEAPKFDGQDPTGWLFRISEYFDFYATAPTERLRLVGLLLEGPTSEWFQWVRNNIILSSWDDFVAQVRLRFDPGHFEDYFGALSKLQQTSTILAYQTEFERLLNKISGVAEPALVSVFIAGLKPLLRRDLTLRRPTSLAAAFALARELSAQYVDTISAATTPQCRQWSSATSSTPSLSSTPPPTSSTNLPLPSTRSDRPIRRLTTAEKLAKDAQGLCYWCDKKWHRNHRCQSRLLLFVGDDDESLDSSTPLDPSADDIPIADVSTLQSLSASSSPRSLRLTGTVIGSPVQVLIDGGSTHNFVHPNIVEKLQLHVQPTTPFRVYVGNGDSLSCTNQCLEVRLHIQGYEFLVDLFILPIHGPGIVLGVQWLQLLGRVTHDYASLTMEFTWHDSPVLLRGDTSPLRQISMNHLFSLADAESLSACYEIVVLPRSAPQLLQPSDPPSDLHPSVREVLLAHAPVFSPPQGLPPRRLFDHRVFLKTGTSPVHVRPYRYPHFQKCEIEKMVQEMLDQGLIRPSRSPFSSPVLLVKKKDVTFRFCVDYRALNAVTVPDHFPIPTADELFDELGAA
ncbi:uncharacterized protein LOC121795456 [Salvia splendens]|uniref:uncharacterized protein LOC121795456 n=1 Tax=Salvia splendens TaxID=180675 RepID=UPI001C25281C|nr:uncharacterized protein LOC121795456 [Salvia splendens]